MYALSLSRESYELLKEINLSEMGDSISVDDDERIIWTDNVKLLLIILNEEIATNGLESGQDSVNAYGRKLYALYDELISQKRD